MTYLTNAPFPHCVSFGATGGPQWLSSVLVTGGGQRYVNQTSNQALRRYDVSHAARKAVLSDALLAHFSVARGPLNSFPFEDFADHTVTVATSALLMLTATTFQMFKRYTAGGVNHDRKILKPKSGTITVTGGTGATVDYTTGIITVSSGTPTAWAGEFWVPTCYEIDTLAEEILPTTEEHRLFGFQGIRLVETRNP